MPTPPGYLKDPVSSLERESEMHRTTKGRTYLAAEAVTPMSDLPWRVTESAVRTNSSTLLSAMDADPAGGFPSDVHGLACNDLPHWDHSDTVRSLLDFYVQQGDVQTCVAIVSTSSLTSMHFYNRVLCSPWF